MKLDTAQREKFRGGGPTLAVDRCFVDFVIYLRDERNIPLASVGISPSKIHGWESKTAQGEALTIRMGVIILLCDALNLWPNREPRLPCITQKAGDAIWTYLRQQCRDWAPDGPSLLDLPEIARWRHPEGVDAKGGRPESAQQLEPEQGELTAGGNPKPLQGSGKAPRRSRSGRLPNPYRGLNAFRPEESHLFFGRAGATKELVERLRRKSLLAVIGPSGSGKSSLVQAGILPHFLDDGAAVVSFRPYQDPFRSLAVAMLKAMNRQERPAKWCQEYQESGQALLDDLRGLGHAGGLVIIYIDQLEELFTLCGSDLRECFLDRLLHYLDCGDVWAQENLKLALTYRTEFHDLAMQHGALRCLLVNNQVQPISPMSETEFREAIVGPAEQCGVEVETSLLEAIMHDAGAERGRLPLLEFCLTKIWGQQNPVEGGKLALQAYRQIGGFAGAITAHADEVLAELTQDGLGGEVRGIFQQLVKVDHSGERNRDVRRPATMQQLARIPSLGGVDSVKRIVHRLTSSETRLLVRDGDAVEVAHEALISEWGALHGWVQEDRRFLVQRDRVEASRASGDETIPLSLLKESVGWLDSVRAGEIHEETRRYIEGCVTSHVAAMLKALVEARAELVPSIIEHWEFKEPSRQVIGQFLAEGVDHRGVKLDEPTIKRLRLALYGMGDESQAVAVLKDAADASFKEFSVTLGMVRPPGQEFLETLNREAIQLSEARATPSALGRLVRTAAILAKYDAGNPVWLRIAPGVAEGLVKEPRAYSEGWDTFFRPVRRFLWEPLAAIVHDPARSELERHVGADLVAELAYDQVDYLVQRSLSADATTYPAYLGKLRENVGRARGLLNDVVTEQATTDGALHRKAQAAITCLHLGSDSRFWPLLERAQDPGCRTYLIHKIAALGVDPRVVVERLHAPAVSNGERAALLLALGEYASLAEGLEDGGRFIRELLEWFQSDPDPGVHSAIDWLCRVKLGREEEIRAADATLADEGRRQGRGWFVNSAMQTFAAVPGPTNTTLGSPSDEPGHAADEEIHTKRISRTYAVATKLVTVSQFREYDPLYEPDLQFSSGERAPATGITWFEAARYCRWLSEREKIPVDQMCFPSVEEIQDGFQPLPAHLDREGYRLPTEAEWEHACRAGTITPRPYGSSESMLCNYAWYLKNTDGLMDRPVGLLKPNDFGLFDILGNAWEWCLESYHPKPSTRGLEDGEDLAPVSSLLKRSERGGSYFNPSRLLRSARRTMFQPADRCDAPYGFRVARTLTTWL